MKKRITVAAIVGAVLAGLAYAAHTIDVFGIVQHMHGR
jgi:hypothetical protein